MEAFPFRKYSTKVPADWVDFNEHLDVHIDLETRRVSPFPKDVLQRLQSIEQEYAKFPQPDKVGSTIKIPVK